MVFFIYCLSSCVSIFFFFCLMRFSDLLYLFSAFVFLLEHSYLTSLLKSKNINHNYFKTVDLPDNIFSLKPKELGPTLRSGRRCGQRACKSLSQLVGCPSDPSVADRADNGAVVHRSLGARNGPSLSLLNPVEDLYLTWRISQVIVPADFLTRPKTEVVRPRHNVPIVICASGRWMPGTDQLETCTR